MGLKYSRPKAQDSLEIKLLDFLYGEWGVHRQKCKNVFQRRQTEHEERGGALSTTPQLNTMTRSQYKILSCSQSQRANYRCALQGGRKWIHHQAGSWADGFAAPAGQCYV